MYTLGKLRHQKKSFSPQSEFRQDELKTLGTRENASLFVTLNGGEGRKTPFPL